MHNDIVNISRKSRDIFIVGNINNKTFKEVCTKIREIELEDNRLRNSQKSFKELPVNIIINSGGGHCIDGLAIIDFFENCNCEIHTYAYGEISSMALIIFMAGDKRFISKNTTALYHRVSTAMSYMPYDEIKIYSDRASRMNDSMLKCMIKYSDLTEDEIKNKLNENAQEWFIYADEIIKYNIADKIIEPVKKINRE